MNFRSRRCGLRTKSRGVVPPIGEGPDRRVVRPCHQSGGVRAVAPLHDELAAIADEEVAVRLRVAFQVLSSEEDSEGLPPLPGVEEEDLHLRPEIA